MADVFYNNAYWPGIVTCEKCGKTARPVHRYPLPPEKVFCPFCGEEVPLVTERVPEYDPDEFFAAERKCHAYRNEKNWIGEIGVCNGTKEREPCSCGGDEQKCDFYAYVRERSRKKPTNADRIRAMSDEELAPKLFDVANYACPPGKEFTTVFCGKYPDCKKCWLDWLKQEVDT